MKGWISISISWQEIFYGISLCAQAPVEAVAEWKAGSRSAALDETGKLNSPPQRLHSVLIIPLFRHFLAHKHLGALFGQFRAVSQNRKGLFLKLLISVWETLFSLQKCWRQLLRKLVYVCHSVAIAIGRQYNASPICFWSKFPRKIPTEKKNWGRQIFRWDASPPEPGLWSSPDPGL